MIATAAPTSLIAPPPRFGTAGRPPRVAQRQRDPQTLRRKPPPVPANGVLHLGIATHGRPRVSSALANFRNCMRRPNAPQLRDPPGRQARYFATIDLGPRSSAG